MRLIFSGPPGAGKGTQAVEFANQCGLAHLATGDMFRNAVEAGTPLGEKARKIMASGALMPDEVVIDIIRTPIEENRESGFILDGFPRTLAQAEALDGLLNQLDTTLDAVISFEIDAEKVRARMRNRAREAGTEAREDDNDAVFTKRMEAYWEHARPLIDYYQQQGKLLTVSADGTIPEVGHTISDALAQKGIALPATIRNK